MLSVRSYREWLARFFPVAPESIHITQTVQPVCLIDDQTLLSARPLLGRMQGTATVPAVAAQYGTIIVRPTSALPIIVRRCFWPTVAGRIRFGLWYSTQTAVPVLNLQEDWNPQQVENPDPEYTYQGQVSSGTHNALLFDDNCGMIPEGIMFELDYFVPPGAWFFFQNDTANTLIQPDLIEWTDIPTDIASLQASKPRR